MSSPFGKVIRKTSEVLKFSCIKMKDDSRLESYSQTDLRTLSKALMLNSVEIFKMDVLISCCRRVLSFPSVFVPCLYSSHSIKMYYPLQKCVCVFLVENLKVISATAEILFD